MLGKAGGGALWKHLNVLQMEAGEIRAGAGSQGETLGGGGLSRKSINKRAKMIY